MIANNKIILSYEFNINIGILDNNYIYIPEIIMLCTGEENLKETIDAIKNSSIENIINKTNIMENNIGKYKGTNIILFLNENYIPNNFIEKKMLIKI